MKHKIAFFTLQTLFLLLLTPYSVWSQCGGTYQVLHYTETSDWDHKTRNQSLAMFQALGIDNNFTVTDDQTGAEFNSLANLQQYAVVVFSNTSGTAILDSTQRANFEAYINTGGSFVGIHAASDTYRHSTANSSINGGITGVWDWYAENCTGASVQNAPNHTSNSHNNDMDHINAHPTLTGIPDPWNKTDEYYYWLNGYLNSTFTELLRVQSTGPQTYDISRLTTQYKIHASGSRVFYTSLGHAKSSYTSDTTFRKLIENAVIWAAAPNAGSTVMTVTASITDETCIGNDGAIDISVNGGTAPLTYSWSNGPTTEDISGLANGSYTITVTDSNSCVTNETFSVSTSSLPTVSININNSISCNGGNDGSLTASASGGTPGYSYAWNSGPTTATINGLSAGVYTVTVTDNAGCTDDSSLTLTTPSMISSTVSLDNSITCFGGNNGAVSVASSGGTPGYTYSWSNGQTNQAISGLVAGTYYVDIEDANNCIKKDSITLSEPSDLIVSASQITAATCATSADGVASVTANGGTPGYTYSWSNGQTTQIAANLNAGSYMVWVTDQNGCIDSASVTITTNINWSVGTIVTQQIQCFGGTDGAIQASISGGVGTYTYSWSNGQTTQTVTNLSAGTYFVYATDINGCVLINSQTLNQPSDISISFTILDSINCFGGNDGQLSGIASGGTPGYTYSWSNGSANSTTNNLPEGTHYLTVTDANGCTKLDSFSLGQPTELTVSVIPTNFISCNGGNDGGVEANVGGGTFPYSYLWNNNQTTQSISNLSAGTYTVNIIDAEGCTAIDSATLSEPIPISLSINVSNPISCFGGNNGELTANYSGGTPGFTFLWSNGQTNATATNLTAGPYSVTITDALGCSETTAFTLNQPSDLTVSANMTQVASCNGAMDGEALATVGGGNIPYTYSWSNGETTNPATNLGIGNHTVIITDANGCTDSATVTISNSIPWSATVSQTSTILCNGDQTGAANVVISGAGTFTYLWSNGQTNAIATNLSANTYQVTITDGVGCSTTEQIVISEPTVLGISATVSDSINCFDGNDGEITALASGGTPSYSYSWSTGQSINPLINVANNNYTAFVIDANGCMDSTSIILSEPTQLSLSLSLGNPISCFGFNDGQASALVSGGSGPYSFLWANGETTSNAIALGSGSQVLTVTDSKGCTITDSITLIQPSALTVSLSITQPISCFGGNDGEILANASGGTPSYSYAWNNGGTNATNSGLVSGISQIVTVTDNRGCTAVDSLTLTAPSALSISANMTQGASCNGALDGEATASASGGTPSYTYSWSDGQLGNNATNLAAGTYIVYVIDANGCMDSSSVIISANLPWSVSVSQTNPILCYGDSTATANVNIVGGGTFSYIWSDGQTTANAVNLPAGAYSVNISDANGCSTTEIITINQPPQLTLSINQTSFIDCFQGNNGAITTNVAGGTPTYSYLWNTGQTNTNLTGLNAGTYSLTLTDGNGCTANDSIRIDEPFRLSLTTAVDNMISCYGANDGEVSVNVIGGTPTYTYSWSNGKTTPNLTGLLAGLYSVVVSDINGCQDSASISLTEPTEMIVAATMISMTSCNGAANGSATVSIQGGNSPYEYLWNNGGITDTLENLSAGQYQVVVTDANGCTSSDSVEIVSDVLWSLDFEVLDSVSCYGGNDGSLLVSVQGGNTTFTYSWDNGQSGNTATNLSKGEYGVWVTDEEGCSDYDSFILSEPDSLRIEVMILHASSGIPNGAIKIDTVEGGVEPYSYLWSTNDTTDFALNLLQGEYSLTVMDANGCTSINSYIIDTTTFDFLDFQAVEDYDNNWVDLTWSSASEFDNDYFTVERSLDSILFEALIDVPSQGNSMVTQNYQTYDTLPLIGTSYYRITQTNKNGSFSYSHIEKVEFYPPLEGVLRAFPVPVTKGEPIDVEFEMERTGSVYLELRSALHQTVYARLFPDPDGRQKFTIPTEGLSIGHYYVIVNNQTEVYSVRVLVID